MSKPLKVLIVEDSEDDAQLIVRELKKGGYDPKFIRVETAEGMKGALENGKWDVVLSDYRMPNFSGLKALAILKESGLDIPFIIASGTIGEELAVEAMKGGANDYVMKDRLGRLCVAIDREIRELTERKKMEEEARQRNRQLIQSEKLASVGELIAGIAHEINNPMMAVLGYSSELSRQARSTGTEREKIFEHLADDLDIVKEAAERCIEITQGLLIYSRTAASEKTKTDIHEIIDKTTALLASECRYHKIILDKKYECAEPTVYGNPTELQQVLTNLIINARDSMPKGGNIHIRTFAPKSNHVGISVKDSGGGIPKENLDKIFEPFFTTKAPGTSTGLGLAIVFEIVKSHKGDISVNSEIGGGTEFTITLPAYSESMTEAK